MKKLVLNLGLVVGLLAFVAFNNPIEKLKVKPGESVVVWKGYKVTGEHQGTISVKQGNLEFEDGMLKGGSFSIDMTSLKVTDLQGEYADKLTGHLKSPDFFGIENYPEANFMIKKVVPRGTPGDYKIIGDLTIKESTKEIKFNANVVEKAGNATATANITIDRSDFDVKYGSGSFFDNLGDKTIYDEFDLEIQLTAGK